MLKSIKIKFDIIELMQFYWESKASKDKLPDSYFLEIAARDEMKVLYGEDFDEQSVRKVMSAVMNNEPLNNATKKEGRFWNYNMWMLEDLNIMRAMIQPIKQLNLDALKEEFKVDSKYEDLEVVFVPGHIEKEYINDNVITFNFFQMSPQPEDPTHILIDGKEVTDYFMDKAREVLK